MGVKPVSTICTFCLCEMLLYYVDWFDSDEIHDGMNLELYYQ